MYKLMPAASREAIGAHSEIGDEFLFIKEYSLQFYL